MYFTPIESLPLPLKKRNFTPMIGANGLSAGKDLYRAKPAVTRDLDLHGRTHTHSQPNVIRH